MAQTNRERIFALRDGYAHCLMDERNYSYDDAFDAAAERYPMPKKKVPRIAQTTKGQYKVENGKVWHRWAVDASAWTAIGLTPADLMQLGVLPGSPTIEVDDE